MSITHSFECAAHGVFEARVEPGETPSCPKGCSHHFVNLVFLTAPNIGTERVRTASRLVREVADSQGLSDIDTSPSRPGDSVADRNFKRSGNQLQAKAVDFQSFMGALTHKENALTRAGFGHAYDPHEWVTDKQSGKVRHVGAQPPLADLPVNQFGVRVLRVREKE